MSREDIGKPDTKPFKNQVQLITYHDSLGGYFGLEWELPAGIPSPDDLGQARCSICRSVHRRVFYLPRRRIHLGYGFHKLQLKIRFLRGHDGTAQTIVPVFQGALFGVVPAAEIQMVPQTPEHIVIDHA